MRLKIEINSREYFTVLGYTKHLFEVNSRWYKGTPQPPFNMDELLGNKLRVRLRVEFRTWEVKPRPPVKPRKADALFSPVVGGAPASARTRVLWRMSISIRLRVLHNELHQSLTV